jgi:hypothetical protein
MFIELARDMEAVADRSFTSRTRLSNGDSEFRFSEDSRVVGTVTVPESFTLRIPLYQGEAPEDLRALFRWKADKEGLTFGSSGTAPNTCGRPASSRSPPKRPRRPACPTSWGASPADPDPGARRGFRTSSLLNLGAAPAAPPFTERHA